MSRNGAGLDTRRLRGTDDHPVLVDPHRHRNVGDAEQLVADVMLVDERGMVRVRRFDPRPRRGRAARIESDRHDFEAVVVLLVPERLPPGQARTGILTTTPTATSSTFFPRSDDNLKTLPSRSGNSSSGASALASARPPTVAGPIDHTCRSSSCTSGAPSRSATTSSRMRPPSTRASGGKGTHTSPRHAPSGLTAQPVACSNAEASASRDVVSTIES